MPPKDSARMFPQLSSIPPTVLPRDPPLYGEGFMGRGGASSDHILGDESIQKYLGVHCGAGCGVPFPCCQWRPRTCVRQAQGCKEAIMGLVPGDSQLSTGSPTLLWLRTPFQQSLALCIRAYLRVNKLYEFSLVLIY